MEQALSERPCLPVPSLAGRLPAGAAWTLGFAPVVLLAFHGGGYDAVIRSQVGLAIWALLAVGGLTGALAPVMPGRRAAATALGLAALGIWSWIGVFGSDSSERTLGEVARIATYLGVLLLGLWWLDRRRAPAAIHGVACAVALVALLAVLSRLQPGMLPGDETGAFLPVAQQRLNWPLNYWNGLAALCALGVPLHVAFAAGHRHVAMRAASAALVPVFALCIYFTLSRGGVVAVATGVLVLAAMFPEPRRLGATVALTGAASAILVAAAAQRAPLGRDLVGGAALHRGDELTAVLIIVMAGTAAVHAALALLGEPAADHAWSGRIRALAPERRPAALVATALAAVLIAGGTTAATGWAGEAWQRFKSPALAQHLDGQGDASRLASLSSNGRYEIWSAATDALAAHPMRGTGPGTFAFWWLRRAPIDQTVADAHSLYLELGAETGVPGVMIGLGFLGALLSAGWGARRLDPGARIAVAAAVAAAWSFCMSAAVDWVWELPVIPVAVLILAAAAFACRRERLDAVAASRRRRIAVAAGALAPGAVLLVVLASAGAVEQSRASARAGDLPAALRQARAAHAIAPGAATPLLQSGLVREAAGDLRGAAADVREAIRREPENWRGPLVLSRLEARLGHARAAVAAFRRARTLNPRHPIFRR